MHRGHCCRSAKFMLLQYLVRRPPIQVRRRTGGRCLGGREAGGKQGKRSVYSGGSCLHAAVRSPAGSACRRHLPHDANRSRPCGPCEALAQHPPYWSHTSPPHPVTRITIAWEGLRHLLAFVPPERCAVAMRALPHAPAGKRLQQGPPRSRVAPSRLSALRACHSGKSAGGGDGTLLGPEQSQAQTPCLVELCFTLPHDRVPKRSSQFQSMSGPGDARGAGARAGRAAYCFMSLVVIGLFFA